ncbi:hypothetical protein PWT90_02055 [Aphanocladium album]|nr:hypothetical protein PWT90_02055 [Aphanocladium album]
MILPPNSGCVKKVSCLEPVELPSSFTAGMRNKKQCELGALRRATKVVTCPGCERLETTIRIRQRHDSLSIVSLTWFSIVFLGIPWLYASKTVGGEFLVHYCGHCGLRLLVYTTFLRRFFVGDDQLTGNPPDQDALRRARITRSPFPQDTELVRKTDFSGWKERYRNEQPVSIFTFGGGLHEIDGFWDAGHSIMLYSVTYPGLDYSWDGKFGANFMWKHRKDKSPPEPVYGPSNASLCVSATRMAGRNDRQHFHTGIAQIAQLKWDVRFYFPEQEPSDQPKLQYRHTIADEMTFDTWQPYFRWQSCQGELVWMRRPVIDAKSATIAESKPKKRVILLDAYDRLVAMVGWEDSKITFREAYNNSMRQRRGEPSTGKPIYTELRLYGNFSERLILEILTSYSALCVQQKRASDFNTLRRRSI